MSLINVNPVLHHQVLPSQLSEIVIFCCRVLYVPMSVKTFTFTECVRTEIKAMGAPNALGRKIHSELTHCCLQSGGRKSQSPCETAFDSVYGRAVKQ